MTDDSVHQRLIKQQSDPQWLRRTAIEEFILARNSHRLIAYVGAYASVHFGYDGWSEMWKKFVDTLPSPDDAVDPASAKFIAREIFNEKSAFDPTTLADILEHLHAIDPKLDAIGFGDFRREFLDQAFGLQNSRPEVAAAAPIIRSLVDRLQIDRFVTTNYDIEIEWELMTRSNERRAAHAAPEKREVWDRLIEQNIRCDNDRYRLTRFVDGHGKVVSDLARQHDYQRLTGFALRSPEIATHILHIHGRYDIPDDAMITRRDYRDRYVQDGHSRLPFSQATRLMFMGNPLLFVGFGAKEADAMRALEQALSDNPNRRENSTFLLWNSSGDAGQDDAQRLWYYRQFGVHVLYDWEIADLSGGERIPRARRTESRDEAKLRNARRMSSSIVNLGILADRAREGLQWQRQYKNGRVRLFRSAQPRYDAVLPAQAQVISLWETRHGSGSHPAPAFADPDEVARQFAVEPRVKFIAGSSGSGRGTCASALRQAIIDRYNAKAARSLATFRVISINAAFATELDSVFHTLSGAFNGVTASSQGFSRLESLEEMSNLFDDPKLDFSRQPVSTIIINGLERFIAHDGSSLSSELDIVLRKVLRLATSDAGRAFEHVAGPDDDFPFNLVLLGTERVKRYLGRLLGPEDEPDTVDCWELRDEAHDHGPAPLNGRTVNLARRIVPHITVNPDFTLSPFQTYFSDVHSRFRGRAHFERTHGLIDKTLRRQTFFEMVLDPDRLGKAGVSHPDLAMQILRALSFIGQPTEADVLRHVSFVRDAVHKLLPAAHPAPVVAASGRVDDIVLIAQSVRQLVKLHLVLPVEHFGGASATDSMRMPYRLGVHKALALEIRERYGAPMADMRLSAGFNLSLFAAQPFDNSVPDIVWHDELGLMVDGLLGASDRPSASIFDSATTTAMQRPDFWSEACAERRSLRLLTPQQLAAMAHPEVGRCLRAALAMLRGYYSVPALMMQDNRTVDTLLREGPLSEYADRLSLLVRVYRDVAAVRDHVRQKLPAAKAVRMGAEPLYPDDLLWIHNELGVIKATQGDLYGARSWLEQAHLINANYVEFADRQQNWLRIQLNFVIVDIERGKIIAAEERLRDIESVIDDLAARSRVDEKMPASFSNIVQCFEKREGTVARGGADYRYPSDLVLATALVLGYRAISLHLHGALVHSANLFQSCLSILLGLDQQRAYSYFQRHAAGLHHSMGNVALADDALRHCVAAAGPTRHPDIDHAGRISMIQYQIPRDNGALGGAMNIPQLSTTLRYARASDMYRLELDACQTLALVHFGNRDTDSALRYVNDALAIAARTGSALRKISLRILLGRIMSLRGDRDQARELIVSASNLATRIHYERAVASAENALVELEPDMVQSRPGVTTVTTR